MFSPGLFSFSCSSPTASKKMSVMISRLYGEGAPGGSAPVGGVSGPLASGSPGGTGRAEEEKEGEERMFSSCWWP